MAQSPAPSDSLSTIRSLQDQDSIYQAFDSYPWSKDNTFLSGLSAILGESGTGTPQGSPQDIATHARVFYYAQRVGVQIDFAQYQAWLAQNPDHKPPDKAAPKADLYVERSASSQNSSGEPNYPIGFAEMLKLLKDGKPVPGIKQIPNTVARGPAVKPVGSRAAPRKPWEKKNDFRQPPDADLPKVLDDEFPAINAAALAPPSEQ
ncbi:hypothetical protein GQ602_001845 [Ophiocordyceps camponoti-floridani]|uniref:Uncharacterized protein n=1 Tax=Ophiocordyceps camponoti-floridani TaxID=2030778 RepID=A0A8H4Q9M0_9HYPO|nr:hypothetical protein GQ602_001845 [Ophiocordyceps camponoti-floridani]